MPNGGIDNCGSCLWNRTSGDRTAGGYCELRGVSISVPYWTYCDNFSFWSETLPCDRPEIVGPVYSSGIFEGYYTRIPWLNSSEPKTYRSGTCSVTGMRFSKGISVADEDTGEEFLFATNEIYCKWIKERPGSEKKGPAARMKTRESSGDKELHGIYTELFHQGALCCDFMHCGKDGAFEFSLDIVSDSDAWRLDDRIRGAILCGAAGDATGRQVEGKIPGTYNPVVGITPSRDRRSSPLGIITDDTQMTWWLAESLLKNARLVPDDLARRFTSEYIRGIGSATKQFVINYKDKKLPWHLSGVPSSGNGAAMRAAPVGMFFRNDLDELKLAAGMQAIITHNDPMAVASSIVVAHAIALLLRMNVQQLTDLGQKSLFCTELADAIEGMEDGKDYKTRGDGRPATLFSRIRNDIPRYLEMKASPREVQKDFLSGAYVLESLPFALYCFLYSPGHVSRVLYNAVNESCDSDTVASLACSFCGALNGLHRAMDYAYWTTVKTDTDADLLPGDGICPCDFSELEYFDELTELAKKLAVSEWKER